MRRRWRVRVTPRDLRVGVLVELDFVFVHLPMVVCRVERMGAVRCREYWRDRHAEDAATLRALEDDDPPPLHTLTWPPPWSHWS